MTTALFIIGAIVLAIGIGVFVLFDLRGGRDERRGTIKLPFIEMDVGSETLILVGIGAAMMFFAAAGGSESDDPTPGPDAGETSTTTEAPDDEPEETTTTSTTTIEPADDEPEETTTTTEAPEDEPEETTTTTEPVMISSVYEIDIAGIVDAVADVNRELGFDGSFITTLEQPEYEVTVDELLRAQSSINDVRSEVTALAGELEAIPEAQQIGQHADLSAAVTSLEEQLDDLDDAWSRMNTAKFPSAQRTAARATWLILDSLAFNVALLSPSNPASGGCPSAPADVSFMCDAADALRDDKVALHTKWESWYVEPDEGDTLRPGASEAERTIADDELYPLLAVRALRVSASMSALDDAGALAPCPSADLTAAADGLVDHTREMAEGFAERNGREKRRAAAAEFDTAIESLLTSFDQCMEG